jgi:hypothetical protein
MDKDKQVSITASAALILIALAGGFAAGQSLPAYDLGPTERAAIENSPEPIVTRSITGRVKEANGSAIVIEASVDPTRPDLPRDREVVVGEDTRIVKQRIKSSSVYQRELEEYAKTLAQDPEAAIYPLAFGESSISSDEIMAGDEVIVESNESVAVPRITAVKIVVQALPPAP